MVQLLWAVNDFSSFSNLDTQLKRNLQVHHTQSDEVQEKSRTSGITFPPISAQTYWKGDALRVTKPASSRTYARPSGLFPGHFTIYDSLHVHAGQRLGAPAHVPGPACNFIYMGGVPQKTYALHMYLQRLKANLRFKKTKHGQFPLKYTWQDPFMNPRAQ